MHNDAETAHVKPRSWFERLSNLLLREPQDQQQLIAILRDAEERSLLSADMLTMMERVLQVSGIQVREVMVPKTQIVTINQESALENLLPVVIESGHSRFPVTASGSEDVIGILLAKDLLKYCFSTAGQVFNLKTLLRPVIFVPQSKRLDILLREFRVNRNHMAVVIDEYGQVAGLITIEDILEQIVGDIEDEYDTDKEDFIKKQSANTYTVKACTPIDDFNNYFNTAFSDEEFDTIGGLILQRLGRLPKKGECARIEDYSFKVLHSDNRRIHLLEVTPLTEINA